MSDISDVLLVLAKQAACIVYPTLSFDTVDQMWDSPELWDLAKGKSITGSDVRISPGWPTSSNLDDDLAAGLSHVTIFPQATERNTTRYPERQHVTAKPVTTLTFAISGLPRDSKIFDTPGVLWDAGNFDLVPGYSNFVIRVGGQVSNPQNVALRINGKFYVYAVQAADTFETIAAALAALVLVDIPETAASGAILTLGPTARLQAARIGGFGTIAKEVRRQERVVQIIVWSPEPGVRDVLAAAIDVALAETRFLVMPDGFGARLIYKNSMVIDSLQKANLYRRDLNFTVEYATTVSKQRAAVIAPSINFNDHVVTF